MFYYYLHLLAKVSTPSSGSLPHVGANAGEFKKALTIVFTVTGSIALLMIVLGGVQYITSQGEPQGVAKAKGTIIYAAVGLAVSILAVTIVGYVIKSLG